MESQKELTRLTVTPSPSLVDLSRLRMGRFDEMTVTFEPLADVAPSLLIRVGDRYFVTGSDDVEVVGLVHCVRVSMVDLSLLEVA